MHVARSTNPAIAAETEAIENSDPAEDAKIAASAAAMAGSGAPGLDAPRREEQ